MNRNLLTNSRLKTFQRCPREEWLRYQMLVSPVGDRHALIFGTAMHVMLEAWWRHFLVDAPEIEPGLSPTPLQSALYALEQSVEAQTKLDAFDRVKLQELMRGYSKRWLNEELEALAVEREFQTPLVNPATGAASRTWVLAGKVDAIARDKRGRVLLVEHKTSSEDIGPGSNYWARLRMDGQVTQYFHGAESIGFPPAACLYDVIGKPKIKPLKATPVDKRKYTRSTKSDPTTRLYAGQREFDETPDEYACRLREDIVSDPSRYYQRGEIVRLESEMRQWDRNIWREAEKMNEDNRLDEHPQRPDSCHRFGSLCGFFAICSGEASMDDRRLYEILPSPHPELVMAKEENRA